MKNFKMIVVGLFCMGALNAFAEGRDHFSVDCSKRVGGNTVGHLTTLSLKGVGDESYEVNELECTLYHGVCLFPYQSNIEEEKLVRDGNIFRGDAIQVTVQPDKVILETKETTTVFTQTECTLSI
jgi:hypothetical protein